MKMKVNDPSSDSEGDISDIEMENDEFSISSYSKKTTDMEIDNDDDNSDDSDDDSEDDDEEVDGDENNVEESSGKSDQKQKSKGAPKDKLYTLPTGEELRQLEETQNLYKSNLFRMQ
eukprot:Awhi_evm1s13243